MKTKTYIYVVNNCYGDPNKVYIGKTINSRKNNHKRKYGIQIEYTIIDEVDSLFRKDWGFWESHWMEQFRQWGFEIVNINKNGGGGREFFTEEQKLAAKGIPRSEETKHKISQSLIGKKRTEEQKQKLRKPKSQEIKNKISQGKKGQKRSFKSKLKQSNTLKGRKITWNLGTKGKNIPQSQKNKISEGNSKPVLQLDKDMNIINEFKSYTDAKKITGIDPQHCLIGRSKSAGGYIWKYKN